MHVWLAESSAQQQTVLVSRYDPSAGVPDPDTLALAFSVSGDQCTLLPLRAFDLDWTGLVRLTLPSRPVLGLLGLLHMGRGRWLHARMLTQTSTS